MNLDGMHVLDLVLAFEQPLGNFDFWLRGASSDASSRLLQAVDSIGGADPVNVSTARLVLGLAESQSSVTTIAEQAGIKPSAVSQRKSRIERILGELFEDQTLQSHPLVVLWRDRASRCVLASDLPNWMLGFLDRGVGNQRWGSPEDIFWVALHAFMRRPRLLVHEDHRWLLDLELDTRAENKGQLRSVADSVCDSLAGGGSVVLASSDFESRLLGAGISRLSLDAFTRTLKTVARRTLIMNDRVLVLDEHDSKNLRSIVRKAIDLLGVHRSDVADLVATQHERSARSVANELRRL